MLDDLKILLGIDVSDRDSDEKLLLILESVRNRLKLLLGGMEVPSSMQHIVTDVAVIRFNRIGSEGMSAHSVLEKVLRTMKMIFPLYGRDTSVS
mgnify:CR=1 FL=1